MINDQQEFRLSEVHIDGDPNRTFVVPPTPSPAPDLDGLTPSTNDMGDDDLIVSKENGGSSWVKKTADKLWNYIKTKMGISAQGSTGKYLDEQGNFTTPTDTTYDAMSSSELSTGTATTLRTMRADYAKDGIKQLMLDMCYPVGSIYISTKNVSPATFLGGTWVAKNGYMLRGATSGVIFNSNTKDGGSDNAIVVSHNHTTPNHSHSFTGTAANYVSGGISANHYHGGTTNAGDGRHSHVVCSPSAHTWGVHWGGMSGGATFEFAPANVNGAIYGGVELRAEGNGFNIDSAHQHGFSTGWVSGDHAHTTTVTPYGTIGNANPTTDSTGSSGTNANLPNYKNVYMWERTA